MRKVQESLWIQTTDRNMPTSRDNMKNYNTKLQKGIASSTFTFVPSSTLQSTITVPHYHSSLHWVAAEGECVQICSNRCFWRTMFFTQ